MSIVHRSLPIAAWAASVRGAQKTDGARRRPSSFTMTRSPDQVFAAMTSAWMFDGISRYSWNSIEFAARPWVIPLRSVV